MAEQQHMICQQYDWNAVLRLVEPYLDDNLYTTLVMQGISSEYRTSEAAIQARGDVANKNVVEILIKLLLQIVTNF